MNMKKIMASVAAAALAVSAMATSAFAAGGMWNFSSKTHSVDAGAASFAVKGDDILNTGAPVSGTLKFSVTAKQNVPAGYQEAGTTQQTFEDVKGAKVVFTFTYTDTAESVEKTEKAVASEVDGVYTLEIAAASAGTVVDEDTYVNLNTKKVTKIEVSVDVPVLTTEGAFNWKVVPVTEISFDDVVGSVAPFDTDIFTKTASTTAGELKVTADTAGLALVADTKTEIGAQSKTLGGRTVSLKQWIGDTIAYNKGAQLKFTFMTSDELAAYGWDDDNWSWGGSQAELPLEGTAATLKDFAIGVNLGATSLLQANGLIKDNTVTFEWDDIMKSYSSTVGDIDTIHVRAKNNVVIKSIEIIIPEQEEIDSEKTNSAEAPEVTGEEGEDTTADLEDPDITDGEEGEEGEDTDSSIEDGEEGEEGEDTSAEEGDNTGDNGEAGNKGENPTTGVALAIVPAIVAGAAVVISRKRK